jgi:hypothetical protein
VTLISTLLKLQKKYLREYENPYIDADLKLYYLGKMEMMSEILKRIYKLRD